MSGNDQKNVFISHYGKDDDKVQAFKKLLKSNQGITIKNSSIDSTKPNDAKSEGYIKTLLRKGISWAGNVVVLIGPKTSSRWWVNWEIEQAAKQGKRIVGVYMQGEKDSEIPEAFQKYGDSLVGWDSANVVAALSGKSDSFKNIDGTPWKGKYTMQTGVCA